MNDGLKSTPLLVCPHSLALHGFHSPPSPLRALCASVRKGISHRATKPTESPLRSLRLCEKFLNPWFLRILQSIGIIAVFWAFAVFFFCV
jgi:hypothetical protein